MLYLGGYWYFPLWQMSQTPEIQEYYLGVNNNHTTVGHILATESSDCLKHQFFWWEDAPAGRRLPPPARHRSAPASGRRPAAAVGHPVDRSHRPRSRDWNRPPRRRPPETVSEPSPAPPHSALAPKMRLRRASPRGSAELPLAAALRQAARPTAGCGGGGRHWRCKAGCRLRVASSGPGPRWRARGTFR